MPLMFEDKELMELMEDFYILTGMKIALFDETCNELISYPSNKENFCSCMRENPEFAAKCRNSDTISFKKCEKTKMLNIYVCHAGLIEATAPIMENGRIIGYMMFGQITDNKNRSEFLQSMRELCDKFNPENLPDKLINKIKYRSSRQILAASKILDACTGYIQLKDLVRLSDKNFVTTVERFIDEHINEEITVKRLCDEFNVGRTTLYKLTSERTEGGIAAFIKNKRLEKARYLIRKTDMSISEISDSVGFSDYNYFVREFKKKYGVSSKAYRKQTKSAN